MTLAIETVLVRGACFKDPVAIALLAAGNHLSPFTPLVALYAKVVDAERIEAVLVGGTLIGFEALDADPGLLVTDHIFVFAVLVGRAGEHLVTVVIRTAVFAVRAVLVTNAHDTPAQVLCADKVTRAVLGGIAGCRNALPFVRANLQLKKADSAVPTTSVGTALTTGAIRRTEFVRRHIRSTHTLRVNRY